MTPEALRQAAITLFGERGWMSRLADALGVDRSSVSRWFAGLPVPGPVAAAVDAWMRLYRLTGLRPDQLDQTTDSTEGGVEPDALRRK
jgi:hypothetical protein